MSQVAPFFTALLHGPEHWTVTGPNAGLVQLVDSGGKSCGSFAFQACPDLRERVAGLLRSFAVEGIVRPRLKIVLDSRLTVSAVSAAAEAGFEIEKLVERSGSFEIRFSPLDGKLQVSVLDIARAREGRKRIRVLIVDDSPLICSILSNILSADSDFEVVGTVGEPAKVEQALELLKPDLVTLDIHLPQMNGVEVLRRYIQPRRLPTVIFTSVSPAEGPLVMNALESGAVDYIQKPSSQEVVALTPMILAKLKAAAKIVLRPGLSTTIEKASVNVRAIEIARLIAIGSSTGGTKALTEILVRLPKEIPPIIVAQHIPAGFSKAFADRLNAICDFEVAEAKHGEIVLPGRVLIAPGGKQLRVLRAKGALVVSIEDSSSEQVHKPSVDVLFQSVREACGQEAIAVLLTGMGSDGAKGMLALRQNGCATIAQDESSCIVFGMPQAAMQLNAAAKMIPLLGIAQELMNEVSGKNRAGQKAG